MNKQILGEKEGNHGSIGYNLICTSAVLEESLMLRDTGKDTGVTE